MINIAIILGRVGFKETKQTKNGSNVTTLSVATSKRFKDSSGQKQEITNWHKINAFSAIGDIANKYVNVGDLVFIEGEIRNVVAVSPDGNKTYYSSITATHIKLLPSGNKKEQNNNAGNESDGSYPVEFDDSIPF